MALPVIRYEPEVVTDRESGTTEDVSEGNVSWIHATAREDSSELSDHEDGSSDVSDREDSSSEECDTYLNSCLGCTGRENVIKDLCAQSELFGKREDVFRRVIAALKMQLRIAENPALVIAPAIIVSLLKVTIFLELISRYSKFIDDNE